jgi:A/G-specific adenine glycosylase
LRSRFHLRSTIAEPLPPFEHAFTHFTLRVQPYHLVAPRSDTANEGVTMWLPLQEVGSAALPSPVKRLLQGLARR